MRILDILTEETRKPDGNFYPTPIPNAEREAGREAAQKDLDKGKSTLTPALRRGPWDLQWELWSRKTGAAPTEAEKKSAMRNFTDYNPKSLTKEPEGKRVIKYTDKHGEVRRVVIPRERDLAAQLLAKANNNKAEYTKVVNQYFDDIKAINGGVNIKDVGRIKTNLFNINRKKFRNETQDSGNNNDPKVQAGAGTEASKGTSKHVKDTVVGSGRPQDSSSRDAMNSNSKAADSANSESAKINNEVYAAATAIMDRNPGMKRPEATKIARKNAPSTTDAVEKRSTAVKDKKAAIEAGDAADLAINHGGSSSRATPAAKAKAKRDPIAAKRKKLESNLSMANKERVGEPPNGISQNAKDNKIKAAQEKLDTFNAENK